MPQHAHAHTDPTLSQIIHAIEDTAATQNHDTHADALHAHIDSTTDQESKAVAYYYLLRIRMSARVFHEHADTRTLYSHMMNAFVAAEQGYQQQIDAEQNAHQVQVLRQQLEAFYQLQTSYLKSLEVMYEEKGIHEARDRTHLARMRVRRRLARHRGQHVVHAGHFFLEHTSGYGHSFVRWAVTVCVFIGLFALMFALLDAGTTPALHWADTPPSVFNYIYFSLINFTTIGYGDIVPSSPAAKVLAGLEGMLGYIMLGLFLTLVQRKM